LKENSIVIEKLKNTVAKIKIIPDSLYDFLSNIYLALQRKKLENNDPI
jgi:hypothetical protein